MSATPAIIRKEYRETVTFSDRPTAETCKHLRGLGFDYDRRNSLWFRKVVNGFSADETSITQQLEIVSRRTPIAF
jgi:hypothetical protein